MSPICYTVARWLKILQKGLKKVLFSAKIGGYLSPKWACKWPRKSLTLLFYYFMCYKHIFSILFYFWGSFDHQITCFLFLHLNFRHTYFIRHTRTYFSYCTLYSTILYKKTNCSSARRDNLIKTFSNFISLLVK